jgi:guanylate kinase
MKPLVTITGPSGVGKTTVVQLMYTFCPDVYTELVSTTTRKPRAGEVDGVAYHFVSGDHFTNLSRAGYFLEEIEYNGTRYGIELSEIDKAYDADLTPLIVVEPHGAQQIRDRYEGPLLQLYFDAPEESRSQWMVGRGDPLCKVATRIDLDRTAITRGDFPWDFVIQNDSTLASLCRKVLTAVGSWSVIRED